MSEEKVVMSAEELWALSEGQYDKYRGPDVERTEFDHKAARDFADFAKALSGSNILDNNVVHRYGNGEKDSDQDDDPNFFDVVKPTN